MLTILSSGGINWTWYLECELHDDDTVTILRHYRLHDDRNSGHPATSGGFRIIESGNRNATSVVIERIENRRFIDKTYKVRNVQYVFSYN